jgi:hypothetical protein
MTRGQIRAKLRRRVQEEVGDAAGGWTDAEMNAEINDAYSWVQKEIFKVFPEAHLFWDYMTLTKSVSWYPLPATFGVSEVSVYDSTSGEYSQLKRHTYQDIKDLNASADAAYAQRGQWIGIFPAPAETIDDTGILVVHTPVMSMSADTDVPRVKTPIHEAIVLKAKDSLLGDMGADMPDNRQRLADLINDIPLWYEHHTDMPDRLSPRGLG